jgi:hypothetical protein
VQLKITALNASKIDLNCSKTKSIKGGAIKTADSRDSLILRLNLEDNQNPSSLDYDYLGGTTPSYDLDSSLNSGFSLGSPGTFD